MEQLDFSNRLRDLPLKEKAELGSKVKRQKRKKIVKGIEEIKDS